MTVKLVIPEEAVEAGRNAALRQQSTKAAIEAAAPLIVAAELDRLAAEYWSSSHLHKVCKARAAELRGGVSR